MTNIELYIDKQICDIVNPEKMGIRLNRVLINPAELSTKDAQYSYSISLPTSARNNTIFGYANVEEVKNKFNVDYDALLIVDGVKVFDGKFRISEIANNAYKGNLVVPVKKTIKDIFGDKKMNQIEGLWEVNFREKPQPLQEGEAKIKGIASIVSETNTADGIPDCIFPYALYGLIPKHPQPKTKSSKPGEEEEKTPDVYSAKDEFDGNYSAPLL